MLDQSILQAMADAGATPEVIVAAVRATQKIEEERATERRAKAAARKRKSRENAKSQHVTRTERDIGEHGVTACDTPSAFPPSSSPPYPPNNYPLSTSPDAAPTARTPEADLFDRGKKILGAKSGGLIKNLVAAKGGNIALARAVVETASTKADPREYLSAVIRGRDSPEDLRARGEAW